MAAADNNITGQPERTTIGFGGDTMIGRLVNEKITTTNYTYPWGNLLPVMKRTDFNIVNLETTLTNCHIKTPKVFNFRADPDKVEVLKQANVQMVNIANNHILDYTEKGLLETIQVLDQARIKHVGAGANLKEALIPQITTQQSIRIGVLGYTDNEPDWKANEKPGTNYLEIGDVEKVKKDVESLKDKVDVIIVSLHWGPNMRQKPTKIFKQFAHKLIDMGVSIIHGHSAHIFQGVEKYHKGLIMYDTGEFVDDYAVDPYLRNDRSFFFLCDVGRNGITRLKLIPIIIKNMQVNKAQNSDYWWCMARMQMLSEELNTVIGDDGVLNF